MILFAILVVSIVLSLLHIECSLWTTATGCTECARSWNVCNKRNRWICWCIFI